MAYVSVLLEKRYKDNVLVCEFEGILTDIPLGGKISMPEDGFMAG